jgi:hypothetical protein
MVNLTSFNFGSGELLVFLQLKPVACCLLTSSIASKVDSLIAFAFPVFIMDRLDMDMLTRSESSCYLDFVNKKLPPPCFR